MDLNAAQVGYFITQIGLSAASFGVSTEDVDGAGLALAKLFGYRCSPPTTVVPAQGPQLQSVCLADDCPVDLNATCDSYELALEPTVANATLAMGEGGNGTNGTGAANSTMITSATLTATESGLTGGSPTGTSSSSGSKTSGTKSAGVAIKAAGSLVSLLLGVLASLV
ncbi:hypothetical protein MMC14_000703 [Varicellaria rhodocarpa]|nr:hypothetical protein [Varicellaria rhodocarpa]